MASLPSGDWLIQQIGDHVVLYHRHTEEEITTFPARDLDAAAEALKAIENSDLTPQDKDLAYFWAGYFHGCAR